MATPNLNGITSVIPGIQYSGQLANGDTAIYTIPANKALKVAKLIISNTSASAVVLSVSVIPSGGAVDGTHKVINNYSIAAYDSVIIEELVGMWLGDGDKINLNSATNAVLDAVLSGLLMS